MIEDKRARQQLAAANGLLQLVAQLYRSERIDPSLHQRLISIYIHMECVCGRLDDVSDGHRRPLDRVTIWQLRFCVMRHSLDRVGC